LISFKIIKRKSKEIVMILIFDIKKKKELSLFMKIATNLE